MKLSRILLLSLLPAVSAFAQVPAPALNTLTAEETAAGFKLLFDGTPKGIGFKGIQKSDFLHAGWKIVDGALTLDKTIKESGKVTGGDLTTMESFVDFEFAFEWKGVVSGNSGVMYFLKSLIGKPQGNEFQLIDDTHHPEGLKGGPIRRTGALSGVLPPNDEKKFEVEGWNKGRIVVQGNKVEHWINDAKVLEYEVGSPAMQQALKAAKLPLGFAAKTRSPVVLLDQGEMISFRNLKVRVIKPGA